MKFLCHYSSQLGVISDQPESYYREIHADDVNEADRLARRMIRKNYILISTKQKL